MMHSIVYDYMDWPRIEAVVYGEEPSPKDVMAPQVTKDGILIQGFFPGAERVSVCSGKKNYEMEEEDEDGYFAVMLPGKKIPSYNFLITKDGETKETADPYAFPTQITEEEEKAFCAGVSYHVYEKLGAHPMTINGTEGTFFAVWAPNAMAVSVVGDFNEWNELSHLMHRMPMSGIFEIFVPGVKAGEIYKYQIRKKGGETQLKADPYAFASEEAPGTASIVAAADGFSWEDAEWMAARKKNGGKAPIAIYETSLTEWENPEQLVSYAKELHYTHVELNPVMAYQTEPFNTFSYYAVDARFGGGAGLKKLINALHKEGIGVILDWAPSHFPKHAEGLENFDGTPLYENPDPGMAVHPMWGTLLYNYESPMVADFLLGNAFYWLEEFHADGLRLDDVDAMLYLDFGREYGQWTPNIYGSNENLAAIELLKHFNSIVHKKQPGILTIAQEDGLWPELTDSVENDHIGFDYKWNNNWTADLLAYLERKPEERKYAHDQLTLSMLYTYCEKYVLALGSRDVGTLKDFSEKLPGTEEQQMAQIRAAYTYGILHPGCVMTAPDKELTEEMKQFTADLNAFYISHPALWKKDNENEGFEWIQLMKYEENVLAFLRVGEKLEDTLLAVVNFSAAPYEGYQVGVPFYGKYKEIFNSDKKEYGGEGTVNPRGKTSLVEECDERECSVKFRIPAYGAAIFSSTPEKCPAKKEAARKTTTEKAAAKTTAKTTAKKTAATKKARGRAKK